MHPEDTRLVARRRNHAARVFTARTADDHRLPTQVRIVALLDRCEERVEVHVEDCPVSHGPIIVRL
jgi:hypothetical protein